MKNNLSGAYLKIQINEVDIEPSMSSSNYFGDFYQIGLVVEKIDKQIPDFMRWFFEQTYFKHQYMYDYVDPQQEVSCFSRAFYINNRTRNYSIFTGENYDFTVDSIGKTDNQSSI